MKKQRLLRKIVFMVPKPTDEMFVHLKAVGVNQIERIKNNYCVLVFNNDNDINNRDRSIRHLIGIYSLNIN